MGLKRLVNRILITVSCLGASVFSFSIGDQIRATATDKNGFVERIHLLVGSDARQELSNTSKERGPSVDQNLLRLLARTAPLDPFPFELKLAEAVAQSDADSAHIYAERVLSYQPRSLAARLYLFNLAAMRSDFESVFDQYEGLVRLKSLGSGIPTEALIGIFRQHGDWTPLLEYLETSPPNGASVARTLIRESIEIELFTNITQVYPMVRQPYLEKLLRVGQTKQAYGLWASYANATDESLQTLPFNGSFAIRDELPPFNWSKEYGRAEFQTGGGLYVTYRGLGNPTIVQQIMAAPPGSYVLRTSVKGRMPRKGGSLAWNLSCHGSNSQIAQSPIELERPLEVEVIETELDIPERGCEFQSLELVGRSGEFPKISTTEVLTVELTPSGRR